MQVLVDTSIWIDHFRKKNPELVALLEQNLALTHSAVIGELACGNLKRRTEILAYLELLPEAQEAISHEVLQMIELRHLYGKGLNWVDAQLLASAYLSNVRLWTNDRQLGRYTEKRF